MEDEGSGGGRSRGPDVKAVALAHFSSPRRAKTVRMSEARDFIIPYVAEGTRLSRFSAAAAPSVSLRRSRLPALHFSSLFFCRCGGHQWVRHRARRAPPPRERRGRSDTPAAAMATARRRCPGSPLTARCRTRRTTSGGAPRGTGSRPSSSSPLQSRRRRHRPRDLA